MKLRVCDSFCSVSSLHQMENTTIKGKIRCFSLNNFLAPVFKGLSLTVVALQHRSPPKGGSVVKLNLHDLTWSHSIPAKTSATCFRRDWQGLKERWKELKRNIRERRIFFSFFASWMRRIKGGWITSGRLETLPVFSAGSSAFISTNTLAKGGEGGRERLNYHKKAAAFIETCYWRAKITLNNNNPPPWKPIKCRQQTLGSPTAPREAAEVGLNDTW